MVGAFHCCFCLSRAARTGTLISPSVPTSHASRRPPSGGEGFFPCRGLSRLRRALAAAISTPGGFDSEFARGLGGGSRFASGARAGLAERNLLLLGSVGGAGERTPAQRAARCPPVPRPGGCFGSAANTVNKQTPSFLPTAIPKLGEIQDPVAINTIVIIIS